MSGNGLRDLREKTGLHWIKRGARVSTSMGPGAISGGMVSPRGTAKVFVKLDGWNHERSMSVVEVKQEEP